MTITSNFIVDTQRCQRNWDLSATIPQDHIDLLVTAATQSPSKQNISYYKTHFITNRQLIESIYWQTPALNRTNTYVKRYNPQVLANLLIVFERKNASEIESVGATRNAELNMYWSGSATDTTLNSIHAETDIAISIGLAYAIITANSLGYKTGPCRCFHQTEVATILGLTGYPLVMLGIGVPNSTLLHNADHTDPSNFLTTYEKEPMEVIWHI